MVENFHTGLGGTGGEAQIFSGKDAGVGQIRHAVHILFREQTVADLILGLPQTAAQRAQHEAAVHAGIGIDPVDDGQDLFFGGLLRQKEFLHVHPHQGGPGFRPLFVGRVRGIGPAADNGQLWRDASRFQLCRLFLQALVHNGGDFFSQQQFCHAGAPS